MTFCQLPFAFGGDAHFAKFTVITINWTTNCIGLIVHVS